MIRFNLLRLTVLVLAGAAIYKAQKQTTLSPEKPTAPLTIATTSPIAPKDLLPGVPAKGEMTKLPPPLVAQRPATKKRPVYRKKKEVKKRTKKINLRRKTRGITKTRAYDGPIKTEVSKKKGGLRRVNIRDAPRITRNRLQRLKIVLITFEGRHGKFRPGLNGIKDLVLRGAARQEEIEDGWGNQFLVHDGFGTGKFSFYSKGPDGIANTLDDLK